MDSDFEEEEELRVPPALVLQSAHAKQEALAAKELGPLVESLRAALAGRAFDPSPGVLTAVALVDASCRGEGEFYQSETWHRCKGARSSFHGRSFVEMRALAEECLGELTRGLERA